MESEERQVIRYRYPAYCRNCKCKHNSSWHREGRIDQEDTIIHWVLPDIHAKSTPMPMRASAKNLPAQRDKPKTVTKVAPIVLSPEHTFIPQERIERYLEEYLNISDKKDTTKDSSYRIDTKYETNFNRFDKDFRESNPNRYESTSTRYESNPNRYASTSGGTIETPRDSCRVARRVPSVPDLPVPHIPSALEREAKERRRKRKTRTVQLDLEVRGDQRFLDRE